MDECDHEFRDAPIAVAIDNAGYTFDKWGWKCIYCGATEEYED